MSNLSTQYLGLELKNPLVVGASSLTLDADAVRKCAAAGAGAVVLKSLFEEQIRLDSAELERSLQQEGTWHSEVFEYMEADIGMRYGTREYLQVVRDCKAAVNIPVIASINCISSEWWQDFASEVAAAGADALELNVAIMPALLSATSEEIEEQCVGIVTTARQAADVPIAVKLSPYWTCLPELVLRLRKAGAAGFVLFNRLYRPTIDIEKMALTVDAPYSTSAELSVALRWICLLAGRINAEFAVTTGVHTDEDVVRALLGGANVVQVVSALYQNGVEHLQKLLDGLAAWMDAKGYDSLGDFRGLMSQAQNPDNEMFGRCQYIKGLVGVE